MSHEEQPKDIRQDVLPAGPKAKADPRSDAVDASCDEEVSSGAPVSETFAPDETADGEAAGSASGETGPNGTSHGNSASDEDTPEHDISEDHSDDFPDDYSDDSPDENDAPADKFSAEEDDFDYDYDEEDFDFDVPAEADDLEASRAAAREARTRSSRSRKKRARMVFVQKAGIGLLICAAIALAVIYVGGCVYFGTHFCFNTTLNGTEVSLMDEDTVETTLLAAAEDYTLTIEGRNGVTDSIDGTDIDLEPIFDGTIGTLISEQSVFTWPVSLFRPTELISDSTASFDSEALAEIITGLAFYDAANVEAPTDATYTLGEDGLEIVEETYGSTPDTSGLTAAVITALDGFLSSLELDDSCYVAPSVTSESEELLATVDALSALMETEITLIFDEGAEGTIGNASILQMLTASDGTLVASAEDEDGTSTMAVTEVVLTSASVTSSETDIAAEDAGDTDEEYALNDSDGDEEEDASDTGETADGEDDASADIGKDDSEKDDSEENASEEDEGTAAEEETDADDDGNEEASSSIELILSGVLSDSFTFSEEQVTAYVNALADEYDTYGNDLEFVTTSGETVTVPGGNYGWLMDRTSTAAALLELLNSGEGGELEIVWTQTAEQFGEDDIGDTYAEVDLDAQKVYLYVDGELVLSTSCVSGKAVDSSRYTPDGVFRITYRKSPATLVGEDYESYVTYWMPFNGGIGFHDASWRSSFGGEIYLTNGSHGCINLPTSAAETLYSYVYTGMPVIVHGGMTPEEAIEYTGYSTASDDDEEDDVTTEEDAAAQEAEIIALAIANYVAIGMTEEEATAQVNADLAEQLAAQQAAAEAAAQAAEQGE